MLGHPSSEDNTKSGKKLIQGLESTGLSINQAGDSALISNTRFPRMIPALKELAVNCTAYGDKN
jgi:hypothetical protein